MHLRLKKWVLLVQCFTFLYFMPQDSSATEPDLAALFEGKAIIRKLEPQHKDGSGSGYELVYLVDAPLDVFWMFKRILLTILY